MPDASNLPPLPENMADVADFGDNIPTDWYHLRVDSVERDVSKSSGNPMAKVKLRVQNEPHTGRVVMIMPSLQAHALFQLKALYKACGYTPGPEGHWPEKTINCEFWGKVEYEEYQGMTLPKIKPYNFRPLAEGRPLK